MHAGDAAYLDSVFRTRNNSFLTDFFPNLKMSCSVAECPNYSHRTASAGVSFFRFPESEELSLRWKHFCRRKGGGREDRRKEINEATARICSDHFTPADFRTKNKDGTPSMKRHLKEGVTPSRFTCIPENVRPASQPMKRPAPVGPSKTVSKKLAKPVDLEAVNLQLRGEIEAMYIQLGNERQKILSLEELVLRLRHENVFLKFLFSVFLGFILVQF